MSGLVLVNDPTYPNLVEQATQQVYALLTAFATDDEFGDKVTLAFNEGLNTERLETLRQQWLVGNFEAFPQIEVRSSAELNGANGAFAAATNTIYLSVEYLEENVGNFEAIADVVLEEYGHFVDAEVNELDAAGDEGDLFFKLVRGVELTESDLFELKAEDDTATITLDGEVIQIEQNIDDVTNVFNQIKTTFNEANDVLSIITENLGGFLETIQDSINNSVYKKLPLIGKTLASTTDDAIEFLDGISNNILEKLYQFEELSNFSQDEVKQVLFDIFERASSELDTIGKLNISSFQEIPDEVLTKLTDKFNSELNKGIAISDAFETALNEALNEASGLFEGNVFPSVDRILDIAFDEFGQKLLISEILEKPIESINNVLQQIADEENIPGNINQNIAPELFTKLLDRDLNPESVKNAVENALKELGVQEDRLTENFFNDTFTKIAQELSNLTLEQALQIPKQLIDEAISNSLGLSSENIDVQGNTLEDLSIEVDLSSENLKIFSDRISLDSDLGLPGLGLTTEGEAQVDMTLGLDLNFGYKDGAFFFDTSEQDEVRVNLDTSLPGLNVEGKLGFLELQIQDDQNVPSNLDADFTVDIVGNSLSELEINPRITLDTAINLDLKTSFDGAVKLPSIITDFKVNFDVDNADSASIDLSQEAKLYFNNNRLNLGEFFKNFATPLLNKVDSFLQPVEPLVNALTKNLNFITEPFPSLGLRPESFAEIMESFASSKGLKLDQYPLVDPDRVTLLDLLYAGGKIYQQIEGEDVGADALKESVPLIMLVKDFKSLVNELKTVSESDYNLGDFEFSLNTINNPIISGNTSVLPDFIKGSIDKFSGDKTEGGIEFPILDRPLIAFNYLLGKDVDLFTYDIPTLDFNVIFPGLSVPIYGPLVFNLSPDIDLTVFEGTPDFGFDTKGFSSDSDGLVDTLLTGFYIDDHYTNEIDNPEIKLTGSIFAGLGIGSPGIYLGNVAELGGKIGAQANFDFINGSDPKKVRLDELEFPFFEIDGKVFAKLEGKVDLSLSKVLQILQALKSAQDASNKFLEEYLKSAIKEAGFDTDIVDGTFKIVKVVTSPVEETYTYLEKIPGIGFAFKWVRKTATRIIDWVTERLVQGTTVLDGISVSLNFESPEHILWSSGDSTSPGENSIELASLEGESLWLNMGPRWEIRNIPDDPGDVAETFSVRENSSGTTTVSAFGLTNSYPTSYSQLQAEGGANDDRIILDISIPANIDGGIGNDEILGGSSDDILAGGEGKDTLSGDSGHDSLVGGDNNDNLDGGTDNDTLTGDDGDDILTGGDGNDNLNGGSGNDSLAGEQGNDLIAGGDGNDNLSGWSGNDTLSGEEGNDRILGNFGNDLLEGGSGNDSLSGNEGEDRLFGGSGKDNLNGGKGNDIITGEEGEDDIFGELGNDYLNGGSDEDFILGGEGLDTLKGENGDDLLDGGEGDDFIQGNIGNDELFGGSIVIIEPILNDNGEQVFDENDRPLFTDPIVLDDFGKDTLDGGEGNDDINGEAGEDLLLGGEGNDILDGEKQDDEVFGEAGEDLLLGGEGNDTLDGGEGNDTVNYDNSPDRVIVNIDETTDYDNPGGFLHSTIVTDRLIPTDTELEFTIAAGTAVDGFGTEDILRNLENIVGSQFDDILIGNEADNRIQALDGNDILVGNPGNDVLDGGNGIDTASYRRNIENVVVNLEQNVAHDGVGGTDSLNSIENVIGSGFDDSIIGDEVNNIIHAGDDDDIVEARDGEDIIFGQAGADTLYAEDGNDFLVGGEDGDILDGGNDTDTASYFTSTERVAVSLETGKGWAGDAKGDELSNIENLEGSEFEDLLTGDDGENIISGLAGNDLIKAKAGDDWLDGGADDDRLFGDEGNDSLDGQTGDDLLKGGIGNDLLNGGEGNDRLFGQAGIDTLEGDNGNDQLFGGSDDDLLSGSDGNDQLYGQQGEDFLEGGNGNDELDGGKQNDLLIGGDGDDRLYGRVGEDSLEGNAGNDLLKGGTGDDLLSGNEGNDRLFGQNGNDRLSGGSGNDELDGGFGNDELQGNEGNDLLYGQDGQDLLDGGTNNDVLWGGNGSDTLAGQADDDYLDGGRDNDRLNGNAGDDDLYGQEGDDQLMGDDGNDYAEGGTGEDSIQGNAGDDRLYGNAGFDILEGGEGHDLLDGGENDDFLYGNAGSDRLFGREGEDYLDGDVGDDRLEGNEGDDQLLGGDGQDLLKGGDGEDQLEGGADDDWLFGGSGVDLLEGGTGNDRLNGEDDNDQLYGNAGDDTLTGGRGNDLLYGNQGADELDGNEGNDFLYGQAGEDSLNGGEGHDNLYGGGNNDRLIGGNGHDLLDGNDGDDRLEGNAGDDQLDGGVGNDSLSGGDDDDQLYGRTGNDRIDAGSGNDYIEAGEGDDRVTAGEGVDRLYGEAGNDTLDAGTGNDRVEGAEGDDVLLGQEGNDDLLGGSGDDRLDGSDGNDFLSGGSGNDELDGGNGENVLNGGFGEDTLIGGDNSDTFILKEGYGTDYVLNFQLEQDILGLMGLTFEEIEISEDTAVAGRAVINVIESGEQLAVLEGIKASDLYRYHFFPVSETEDNTLNLI